MKDEKKTSTRWEGGGGGWLRCGFEEFEIVNKDLDCCATWKKHAVVTKAHNGNID